MRKSKIILEIRKKTKFLKITNKFSIYKLLKDLTKTREKSYQAVRFSYGPPLKILKYTRTENKRRSSDNDRQE